MTGSDVASRGARAAPPVFSGICRHCRALYLGGRRVPRHIAGACHQCATRSVFSAPRETQTRIRLARRPFPRGLRDGELPRGALCDMRSDQYLGRRRRVGVQPGQVTSECPVAAFMERCCAPRQSLSKTSGPAENLILRGLRWLILTRAPLSPFAVSPKAAARTPQPLNRSGRPSGRPALNRAPWPRCARASEWRTGGPEGPPLRLPASIISHTTLGHDVRGRSAHPGWTRSGIRAPGRQAPRARTATAARRP